MLDWLSNEQRTSYAEVSQILDAPETPAPVFAYRALKSVLFGSYDGGESDDDNKENISPQTQGEKCASSDIAYLKHEKKYETSTPTRPTPRHRLSPAKSILRTPGIPAPRRQSGSVRFKEIKQTTCNLDTINEASVTEEEAVARQPKLPPPRPAKCQTIGEKEEVVTVEVHAPDRESEPEIYYHVKEMDAYIAATEHEMKKLVRYGQRMRELARVSQKENASLKRQLEKVRTENESLRRRQHSAKCQENVGQRGDRAGLFDLSFSPKLEPDAAGQKHYGGEPQPTERPATGPAQRQLHPGNDKQPPKGHPSPTLIHRGSEHSTAGKSDVKALIEPASTSDPRRRGNKRVASRTQLPPDKLEAAKERLRLKSEERRKALGMAEQAEREHHVSSVVDWHNL